MIFIIIKIWRETLSEEEKKGKFDTPIKKADSGYRELNNIESYQIINSEKKEKQKK